MSNKKNFIERVYSTISGTLTMLLFLGFGLFLDAVMIVKQTQPLWFIMMLIIMQTPEFIRAIIKLVKHIISRMPKEKELNDEIIDDINL